VILYLLSDTHTQAHTESPFFFLYLAVLREDVLSIVVSTMALLSWQPFAPCATTLLWTTMR